MKKNIIFGIILAKILFGGSISSFATSIESKKYKAYFDIKIPEQILKHNIAGAVVTVVKNGKIIASKGYGYADKKNRINVDPDKHLFRIASITKLFTWTAIMQLVENGKLNLNEDINTYLDFKIPETFQKPITLYHLLTHTSGFQDKYFDVMPNSVEEMSAPGDWLKTHMPDRYLPPGEHSAYSNYGAALAGYIVGLVSGMPYETYIKENILAPLEMNSTTPALDIPYDLKKNVSNGYSFKNGKHKIIKFELMEDAPAGSMSATASDIAKFMLAHLRLGKYKNKRILKEKTAAMMHKTHFRHDSRLNGMALGFIESNHNSRKIIGHTGNIEAFHSILALLPEHDLGIFISYNTDTAAKLTYGPFLKEITNYFYPVNENNGNRSRGFLLYKLK